MSKLDSNSSAHSSGLHEVCISPPDSASKSAKTAGWLQYTACFLTSCLSQTVLLNFIVKQSTAVETVNSVITSVEIVNSVTALVGLY